MKFVVYYFSYFMTHLYTISLNLFRTFVNDYLGLPIRLILYLYIFKIILHFINFKIFFISSILKL